MAPVSAPEGDDQAQSTVAARGTREKLTFGEFAERRRAIAADRLLNQAIRPRQHRLWNGEVQGSSST